MRFAWLFVALIGLAPALAGQMPAAPATPTLAVVMDFDEHYSPTFLLELEQELADILRPCSLNLQFRVLDESTPKESFSNLVVARFRGRCENQENPAEETPRATLGFTHISEGQVLPFSEVDCNRVSGFVAPQVSRAPENQRERLLGRALGRVLAHELYHILTKTTSHARRGIAKPMLTIQDLVRPDVGFEDAQARSIHRALAPKPPVMHRAAR